MECEHPSAHLAGAREYRIDQTHLDEIMTESLDSPSARRTCITEYCSFSLVIGGLTQSNQFPRTALADRLEVT